MYAPMLALVEPVRACILNARHLQVRRKGRVAVRSLHMFHPMLAFFTLKEGVRDNFFQPSVWIFPYCVRCIGLRP